MKTLTLIILLDAGRHDYPGTMPFLKELSKKSIRVNNVYNNGGYCERTCFMTGTTPDISGNLFAMSLLYPGYKRADYEVQFNIPKHLRDRLCMTEDVIPDTEPNAFFNPETGSIESIWDVFRENKKTWAFEACLALGVKSHKGITTHGARAIQLVSKLKNERPDVAYWQISRIDQEAHVRGSDPEKMEKVLLWANGEIERVVTEAEKLYDKVNLVIFGDHGQTPVVAHIDPPLEYPPFREGWDYLYLKSSAAIQFWVFNDRVRKCITDDPRLKGGKFIDSPNSRQGDLIWTAPPGVLVSPCHFHPRGNEPVSMHGYQMYDKDIETEKGFAIIYDGETSGEIEQIELVDMCKTITDVVGVRPTKQNIGRSIYALLNND